MGKNILIRSVNWIGDAVMTIPAIRAIKRSHSDSELSLLVRPSVKDIFLRNPDIAEFMLYEDQHRSFVGRLKLASELRKRGFSKAILLQNAFDAALIAFLARIPERIGYSRDGRGLLLTEAVPYNNEDKKLHHIDYYLNLVNHFTKNSQATSFQPYIFLNLEERIAMRKRLEDLPRPILGINPGATFGSAKRWLPERFAEVAGWFIEDTNGSIVITGTEEERVIAEEIIKRLTPEMRLSGPIRNFAGSTSLRDLIGLISECDLYLSNDSGPMHIAYAVGTPLVALFGSTDPNLTGPRGEGSIIIRSDVDCSPCFKRTCDKDLICMYGINSEDVFLALKRLIPTKSAIFFDRDGTLCEDVNYLNDWNKLRVFDDIDCIRSLKDRGFLLIGISNQSGISRGLVNEDFVKAVNSYFIERYGFDDFYYCPHHPDENCSCRKPELGMVHRARVKHNIDLKCSYVIGDKSDDMLLAQACGAKGILVKTGKEKTSPHATEIVENLKEAVRLIISNEE